MHTLYANKDNRDAAYRALQAQGLPAKRNTVRNQRLHPMYIEDEPNGETGFGNTDYLTTWPVLYTLEVQS